MTEARKQLPLLLDKAQRGEWQLIGRRGRVEVILAGADEVSQLLARCFTFSPRVFVEPENVGIYLSELDVHGVGATLAEAQADLADVVLGYVDHWQDELHAYPDHQAKAGYVRRVQIAGDEASVGRLLFGVDYEAASPD